MTRLAAQNLVTHVTGLKLFDVFFILPARHRFKVSFNSSFFES